MATGLERTAISPHTMQAGQIAPQRPTLAQTAISPLARAYQAYQQYVGEPFQQIVRGGVRGYFGLPVMTDASSLGREAYRQGEALGFTPGVGMPAGAVRMAAEGMQALPSIAGDIGRVIGGLPSGAAARQAEDFAAYQRSIPPSDVSPLTAFHGTPHRFAAEEGAPLGRFRPGKIGTGEGAQAYGYGLYFAENPKVAGSYAELSPIKGLKNSPEFSSLSKDVQIKVLKAFQQDSDKGREVALRKIIEQHPEADIISLNNYKNLYTVDIPDAMVDKMLDWDKPLVEQSQEIQQLAKQYGLTHPDDLGGDLLSAVGGKRAAGAKILRDAGIPGVRYFDQSTRRGSNKEITRNIVVFPGEEQNVKILSRE